MARPIRKQKGPEISPERKPRASDKEIVEVKVAANENEEEEAFLERTGQELERELGKGRPLEVHMRDIRMLRAFRNAFPSLKHKNPEDLHMYVIHPDFNVAITRAFGLKNSENVTLLAGSKSERRVLDSKGYEAVKGNAERKQLSEKQDLVIVMDDSVRPTSRLLKNVAPGGWILWPVSSANALRGMGKFKCAGILENEGVSPSVQHVSEDFWKKAEIGTDEELKQASEDEGVVTFEEAERAVETAFGTKRDIVKNYKRLIELAEEQHGAAIENGATEVMCTVERDGTTVEIPVKLVLPLREEGFRAQGGGDFAIFRRREVM